MQYQQEYESVQLLPDHVQQFRSSFIRRD